MKSRYLKKSRRLGDYIAEKCMEWLGCFCSLFRNRRQYHSNLVEEYIIKSAYIDQDFVRSFLQEREKAISHNRYSMRIKEEIGDDGDMLTIGRVRLLRNRKHIDEARLVIKQNDERKIIYWSFE